MYFFLLHHLTVLTTTKKKVRTKAVQNNIDIHREQKKRILIKDKN